MIAIVGGGPAGLYTAHLLAKAGMDVNVYEEHSEIGRPVQCTGIVTKSINELLRLPKNTVVNKVKIARINAGKKKLELKVNDIILDRRAFDCFLAETAVSTGAKIIFNSKVKGAFRKKSGMPGIIVGNNEISASAVIGADGPFSVIRKAVDKRKISFYAGKQAVVKGEFDPDIYDVFLGSFAPGFFGWIVPEGEKTARVGIACRGNPNLGFNMLMKNNGFDKSDILSYQSGLIPIHDPKLKTSNSGFYLVGDSAAQVKATTGGGIIPGLRAGKCLAKSIISGSNYDSEWKNSVGRDLWLDLQLRKTLDSMTAKDYTHLFELLSSKRARNSLLKNDRDNPIPLLFSLAVREPRLFKYGIKLLKSVVR